MTTGNGNDSGQPRVVVHGIDVATLYPPGIEGRAMTIDELAAGFDVWAARYEAHPEEFNDRIGGDTYGDDCARFLFDLLDELAEIHGEQELAALGDLDAPVPYVLPDEG